MEVNYGKESKCENPNCEGKSNFYEWCKKRGCEHERNRNNYMRLCRSCHRKYDMTTEKMVKAIENLYWKTKKVRLLKRTGKKYKENYV